MDREWEIFTGGRHAMPPTPTARIYASGEIVLNTAAYTLLQAPEYVAFSYIRAKRYIGIRAATKDTPGRVKIGQRGRSAGYYCDAKLLFRFMEWPLPTRPQQYTIEQEGDLLVINLEAAP